LTDPFDDPLDGWWPAGANGDRSRTAPGLIADRSAVVDPFMRHGWGWDGLDAHPGYTHVAKITVGNDSNPLARPVWPDTFRCAPE
jgi:hypothetical protein